MPKAKAHYDFKIKPHIVAECHVCRLNHAREPPVLILIQNVDAFSAPHPGQLIFVVKPALTSSSLGPQLV